MKTEYLLNREVEHVLSALTEVNRLVCQISLHTGLRLGDVLALKPEFVSSRFTIIEQKTGKKRTVGLTKLLLEQIRQVEGSVWVFENRLDPSRHRTRQAVYADVKRAAKAFRLKQNAAPHSFRKVYAVELLRKYNSIKRVQRALNHSSSSITMIYALADDLLVKSHGKRRRAAR